MPSLAKQPSLHPGFLPSSVSPSHLPFPPTPPHSSLHLLLVLLIPPILRILSIPMAIPPMQRTSSRITQDPPLLNKRLVRPPIRLNIPQLRVLAIPVPDRSRNGMRGRRASFIPWTDIILGISLSFFIVAPSSSPGRYLHLLSTAQRRHGHQAHRCLIACSTS